MVQALIHLDPVCAREEVLGVRTMMAFLDLLHLLLRWVFHLPVIQVCIPDTDILGLRVVRWAVEDILRGPL